MEIGILKMWRFKYILNDIAVSNELKNLLHSWETS